MNLLGRFKKKKTYSKNNEFKLCIISDDTDSMHERLGITNKRAEELANICLKAFGAHQCITDSYQDILAECTHINEVIMCTEIYQKIRQMKSKEHHLNQMLGNLFRNGE